MTFQRLAALVKNNRILEVDFALLETRNDSFKLFQSCFEAKLLDRGFGFDF